MKRLFIFLGIVLTLSLLLALYVGHFFNDQGGWVYGVLLSIFPIFIISDSLRRRQKWVGLYTVSAVMLGSYSIAVGATTVGYLAKWAGVPAYWTQVFVVAAVAMGTLIALAVHVKGPKVVTIDLTQKEPFSAHKKRMTVVQLTDIHLTHHTRLSWVKALVQTVNSLSQI